MANEATSLINASKMKQRIMNMIENELLQDYNLDDLLNRRNQSNAVQKRNLAGTAEYATFGSAGGTTVGP